MFEIKDVTKKNEPQKNIGDENKQIDTQNTSCYPDNCTPSLPCGPECNPYLSCRPNG